MAERPASRASVSVVAKDYQRFERAVLQLATAICPQEVHCQACRNRASVALQESSERLGRENGGADVRAEFVQGKKEKR